MEPTDQEIYRLLYRLGITANYAGFFHLRREASTRRIIRESRRASRSCSLRSSRRRAAAAEAPTARRARSSTSRASCTAA